MNKEADPSIPTDIYLLYVVSIFVAAARHFVDIKVFAVDQTWSSFNLVLRKELR